MKAHLLHWGPWTKGHVVVLIETSRGERRTLVIPQTSLRKLQSTRH